MVCRRLTPNVSGEHARAAAMLSLAFMTVCGDEHPRQCIRGKAALKISPPPLPPRDEDPSLIYRRSL